jgi:hypothetical protein
MLAKVPGLFQEVFSVLAQVFGVSADALHGLAVAAANRKANFFSSIGRQSQSNP